MNGGLKVLIHQGEIEQIRHYIIERRNGKTSHTCGDLYGLWRHSFQPVIQLVSGPCSENYDDEYRKSFHQAIYSKHSLRRIGIWVSVDHGYEEMTSRDVKANIDWKWKDVGDPSYFLVMLVESHEKPLTVKFYLWDISDLQSYPEVREIDADHSADVLPGNSSFRIYEPLIKELQKLNGRISIKAKEFERKPAGEVMKVSTEQWYSTEEGLEILRKLNEVMYKRYPNAGMSSDPTTNNIGFSFVHKRQEYLLEFPCGFPRDSAYLKSPKDTQINIKIASYKSIDELIREIFERIRDIFNEFDVAERESREHKHNRAQPQPSQLHSGVQQNMTCPQPGQPRTGGQHNMTQPQPGQPRTQGQQNMTYPQPGQPRTQGQQNMTYPQPGQPRTQGQQNMTYPQPGQLHSGGQQNVTQPQPGQPRTQGQHNMDQHGASLAGHKNDQQGNLQYNSSV